MLDRLRRSPHLYVGKSTLEHGGMGVHTEYDLPKGSVIEEAHVLILDQKMHEIDHKLQKYVFAFLGKSAVGFGFSSIYNHSEDNPNVMWEVDADNNILKFSTIRDIKRGEELFVNYGKGYMERIGFI
jgi:hypothetical protein